EWETSLLLDLAPQLVHTDRAADLGELPRMRDEFDYITLRGRVSFAWLTEDVSTTGTLGDPRKATPERGEMLARQMVDRLAAVLEEITRFEMPIPAGESNADT